MELYKIKMLASLDGDTKLTFHPENVANAYSQEFELSKIAILQRFESESLNQMVINSTAVLAVNIDDRFMTNLQKISMKSLSNLINIKTKPFIM